MEGQVGGDSLGVGDLEARSPGDLDAERIAQAEVDEPEPPTIIPAGPMPSIPWESLANPILHLDDEAVEDATLGWEGGTWHLFFSQLQEDPLRPRVGHATSKDMSEWQLVGEPWDLPEAAGLASPELVLGPGGERWITMNSLTVDVEAMPKLYLRRAPSLWGPWGPLELFGEPDVTLPYERYIDAALAVTSGPLVLGYKHWQAPSLAWSPNADPEGPWTFLGVPDVGAMDNGQFLPIDGTWHLLGTTEPDHQARLFQRLDSPLDSAEGWLKWTEVGTFEIPEEPWNTAERSNSAHLLDARETQGAWFVLYAGSTEVASFEGRGHAAIGIARSADLEAWEVP